MGTLRAHLRPDGDFLRLASTVRTDETDGSLRAAREQIAALEARIKVLESLTETDELTGLLNRRGFRRILTRNLASAARYDETGILAFIDLDDFKLVNDQLSHGTGDEVLRSVGRFLTRHIRATDYAARIGGDEFAILLVRADHSPARRRARQLIAKLNRETVTVGRHTVRLKASIGLASYDGGTDIEDLVRRADRAMYRNKKNRQKKPVS